ncbi:unnamed protein product [Pedinophyceae sp. YPF-701]|nr:unnamed protein product [Pedinophyceae sp. YPF-701]
MSIIKKIKSALATRRGEAAAGRASPAPQLSGNEQEASSASDNVDRHGKLDKLTSLKKIGLSDRPDVPVGEMIVMPKDAEAKRDASRAQWWVVGHACPAALRRSEWCVNQFEPVKQLGKGAKSRVWEARETASGLTLVLKAYDLRKMHGGEIAQLEREATIHCNLPPHRSVVSLFAAFQDSVACYFLMEKGGKDLYQTMSKRVTSSEEWLVRTVVHPILEGLAHCHAHAVMHRDIKPENFLFGVDGRLRVADFGFAIDVSKYRPTTRLGTLEFMAPEVVTSGRQRDGSTLPRDKRKPYDFGADVWSVGIIVYELLVGQTPFARMTLADTTQAIETSHVSYPPFLSTHAKSFLRACLARNPKERATMAELMQHPWVVAAVGSPTATRRVSRNVEAVMSSGAYAAECTKDVDGIVARQGSWASGPATGSRSLYAGGGLPSVASDRRCTAEATPAPALDSAGSGCQGTLSRLGRQAGVQQSSPAPCLHPVASMGGIANASSGRTLLHQTLTPNRVRRPRAGSASGPAGVAATCTPAQRIANDVRALRMQNNAGDRASIDSNTGSNTFMRTPRVTGRTSLDDLVPAGRTASVTQASKLGPALVHRDRIVSYASTVATNRLR